MSIKNNIIEIKNRINEACKKVNRDPNEITLIAVSKTMTNEDIIEAASFGMTNFGENKVQELSTKYNEINNPSLKWHQIGHLQRNKVKYIIDKVELIHSVDSIKLASKINDEALKRNITANILIQVNIANEETKFGISRNEAHHIIREIDKMSQINIKGLMTIAPYVENSEINRIHFRTLKDLHVDISSKNKDNIFKVKNSFDILSMGMTNDYEVAIEEGANMIRIGTGIFGVRE
ncbi:MAG TPA: YggS family pyridoxal phosphate-dependent enzyme [Clostridiales bacterium]|nr:YggS family pyridoxal phosphate-dependent enzyme [Clostridiales bacterium]